MDTNDDIAEKLRIGETRRYRVALAPGMYGQGDDVRHIKQWCSVVVERTLQYRYQSIKSTPEWTQTGYFWGTLRAEESDIREERVEIPAPTIDVPRPSLPRSRWVRLWWWLRRWKVQHPPHRLPVATATETKP